MRITKLITTSMLAGALALSGTHISQAAEISTDLNQNLHKSQIFLGERTSSLFYSDENLDKFAQDLEILFTRYIPQIQGKYVVNEKNVIDDGYSDQISEFRTVAEAFNKTKEELSSQNTTDFTQGTTATTNSAGTYAKCVVLGALGIPATAFTYGTWTAITTAISAWNWGLAASTVARALGPAFISGAGKALGGPAMIASALAVAAVSCTL